jgi:hypothetical protein
MRVLQALLVYSAYFSEISFDYNGHILSPPRRDWRYLICKKVNIDLVSRRTRQDAEERKENSQNTTDIFLVAMPVVATPIVSGM